MAETNDEGMSLADVKRRFVEAESQLKSVGDTAMSLAKSSSQLDAAKSSVQGASQQLVGLAGDLREVTQGLARATGAIEKIDPAKIAGELETIKQEGQERGQTVASLGKQLNASLGLQRALVVAAIILQLGTLAAVLWVKFG